MEPQTHFEKGLYRLFTLPVKLTTSLVLFLSLLAFNNYALGADGGLLWAFDGVGVSQASGTQRIFNMASDGNGGAFFAWEDENAGGIRAQRIDSSGTALWLPTDGVAISTTGSSVYVIKSSTGDAIIAWDQPSGIYVQKVNTSGVIQWASGGVQVGTSGESPIMVSDNTGGTFVVWGESMRLAHINSGGTVTAPGVNGIYLGSSVRLPGYKDISTDGSGGVIVVWADFAKNIVAQRVNGGPLWGGPPTFPPTVVSNDVRDEGPVDIDYDGANGVVITWKGSQIFPAANAQIRAQRLNSSGTSLWSANGVVVVDSAVVGGTQTSWVNFEVTSSIATDGAGGAIVAWNDWRNDISSAGNDDVYAQRIDSSGNLLWTANGVLLPLFIQGSTAPGSQRGTKTVSDLVGGAIVTYQDKGGWSWDISATRLDSAGNKLWSKFIFTDSFSQADPGVVQKWPDILYDGSGAVPLGAIIGWADNGSADLFAQKVEIAPPAPDNDDCANATPIGDGTYSGSTLYATNDGTSSCGTSGSSPDVWYEYTASCSGFLKVDTCGSYYDTVLSIHDGCPAAGNEIACNDDCADTLLPCDGSLESCLGFTVTAGDSYWIRVTGYGEDSGDFTLNVEMTAPANDDCANALAITEGSTVFSNCLATTDGPDEPGSCNFSGNTQVGSDIWYRYFASCTGTATVSLCDSAYDTKLAIYGSTCPTASGQTIACNDDFCGLQSEVNFPVIQGNDYLIRVGGFAGEQGLGSMTITTNPADLNDDCREDYRDFAIVGVQWQAVNCVTPTWCGRADINHDGFVNLDDLSILSLYWLGHAGP